MSVVLKKYNFSFYKKKVISPASGSEKFLSIFNAADDSNFIVADFFGNFFTSVHLQSSVLGIDQVMNNSIIEGETGSQSGVAVYIKNDFTKFVGFTYSGTYLTPDFIMSTADFKQIAIEWKNFISI